MSMSYGKIFLLMCGMAFLGAGEVLLLEHFGLAPNNLFRLGITFAILGVVMLTIAILGLKVKNLLAKK